MWRFRRLQWIPFLEFSRIQDPAARLKSTPQCKTGSVLLLPRSFSGFCFYCCVILRGCFVFSFRRSLRDVRLLSWPKRKEGGFISCVPPNENRSSRVIVKKSDFVPVVCLRRLSACDAESRDFRARKNVAQLCCVSRWPSKVQIQNIFPR